ncbi:ABC transporter substrate-binding protein [Paenibacillus prosopidis]|uniref:Sorbitol/mannitol transport system substrate-binding protein n=1 Tax=Paenibacillus prosopidis TaxID=630520 RepID=A0A368VPM8_9BACL|nr:sugar ABC transporter substrate-binding protein [Paenibacillus prosopidis]RCW41100.1 sorbitol/mannitol transport system substrate-binding protein [Paenibacillus prosopidis]
MKKIVTLFALLSLVFVLVLSGCGSEGANKEQESGNNGAQNAGNSTDGDKKKENVTLRIATVNNPDMIVMKEMSSEFTKETGINLEFVVLPENDLREKVTTDVAMQAGMFDIVTIGTYDASIWAKNEWIEPLTPMMDKMSDQEKSDYDVEDIFPSIRDALSYENNLYALPFYGESSMLYYNKEMLQKAGVEMPLHPTWDQVRDISKKVKEANNVPGLVLRGLPGWGEVLAPLNTVINSFGGSWYDMDWNAQLTSPETKKAVQFYVDVLKESGQPGATSTGFTEALTLLSTGKAAMWYDATVAAGFLNNPENSQVAGKIGYAFAPSEAKDNNGWLWAWSLGIESASKHKEEAFKFLTWATSKRYIEQVGESKGWVVAPPGTRKSTYDNPKYKEAAPFADIVLESMTQADYMKPTKNPVPYQGIQYVAIPEFQQLGTSVSQEIAAAIAGKKSVDEALENAQKLAEEIAVSGGYKK